MNHAAQIFLYSFYFLNILSHYFPFPVFFILSWRSEFPSGCFLCQPEEFSLAFLKGVDMLATDSLSLLLPGNVIISPLLLKNTFTEYRILEDDSFYFWHFKT